LTILKRKQNTKKSTLKKSPSKIKIKKIISLPRQLGIFEQEVTVNHEDQRSCKSK
jgi:hypothetical protein